MSETTEALLPCPFCGAVPPPDAFVAYPNTYGEIVAEYECDCGIPAVYESEPLDTAPDALAALRARAIARWNTRAPSPIPERALALLREMGEGGLEWGIALRRQLAAEVTRLCAEHDAMLARAHARGRARDLLEGDMIGE